MPVLQAIAKPLPIVKTEKFASRMYVDLVPKIQTAPTVTFAKRVAVVLVVETKSNAGPTKSAIHKRLLAKDA